MMKKISALMVAAMMVSAIALPNRAKADVIYISGGAALSTTVVVLLIILLKDTNVQMLQSDAAEFAASTEGREASQLLRKNIESAREQLTKQGDARGVALTDQQIAALIATGEDHES
jgi:hypothetical protein